MNYLLFIPLALFLISFGSIMLEGKNRNPMNQTFAGGAVLDTVFAIAACIFNIIIFCNMFEIAWYWSLLITVAITFLGGVFLAEIYASILGIKTSPQLNLRTGMEERINIYRMNAVITFAAGVITFFIFN